MVYIHLNELPNAKAVGRMVKRYFTDGRFIDPSFAIDYADKPTQVYEQVKERRDFSGYSRWNNDVQRGQRPRLINSSRNVELYANYSNTWRARRGEGAPRIEGEKKSGEEQLQVKTSRNLDIEGDGAVETKPLSNRELLAKALYAVQSKKIVK